MQWVLDHLGDISSLGLQHIWLSGVPLVLGLLISIPVGWLATRTRWLRGILITGSGLLYTIPSLALFVLMPLVLGTSILSPLNVVVAMTIYTIALLVRSVVDGLTSVPEEVARSATAMGYTPARRFFGVDLPLAVPVIAAGLRVAAVSSVSMISIASLIGVSQLGDLLVDGFNRDIAGELFAGVLASILLAIAFDVLIRLAEHTLTPWRRVQQGGGT
ncbi:ABC transporter permease [Janibacter corallicola]|uniref:ABC transporter permease n=1 Tax=Janibacter corallicola TaxID=415212 RepID=UPI000832BF12|nr:ABC transporter permease [Janibacter corallicola]